MTRALCGAAVLMAAALLLAVAGGAATLPGGTAIDAAVTSPLDGATLPDAPLTITGNASVGLGAAVANTTLIYIVDVSNSTSSSTGGTLCPNQNIYDTLANTTLDCELLAVRDLNNQAIAKGTVAKVGFIGFAGGNGLSSGAALDLDGAGVPTSLVAPDLSNFTPPAAIAKVFTPANNLDWVVQSAFLASGATTVTGWPTRPVNTDGFSQFALHALGTTTNYYAALSALKTLLTGVTTPSTQVVFLSDGLPNETVSGQPLASLLTQLPPTFSTSSGTTHLTIDTFAVTGAGSTCGTNPPANINGSLQQIAAAYGKTCHPLLNPQDATTEVPDVISSRLSTAALTVDGSGVATSILPSLPVNGPNSVALSAGPLTLSAGTHELCAEASGSDGGGAGSAGPNCIQVTIKAAPTITLTGTAGGGGTIPEGGSFSVSATVGGTFTSSTWSASGGTGHCTPTDASALNTAFTCDDDGDYTLTLTVHDGVNPDVIATEHLHVTNVAPTATLTLDPSTVPLSSGATIARIPITDPGADSWTCVITWGDGTTDTVVRSIPTCDLPHTYTAAGPFPVHVQVTDDDNGTGGADAGIVVQPPPAITGGPTDGTNGFAAEIPEGSPFAITGVDAGSGSATHWEATGGTGTCTFTDANSSNPAVTCTDDGLYALTLTATDSFGQQSHKTFHVQVDNVAPVATMTLTPALVPLAAANVHAHVAMLDPGADEWTCTIDWGDGTTSSTPSSSVPACDADHTYAAAGPFHVAVSAGDGDGGTGHDAGAVTVKGAPTFTGVPTDGAGGTAGAVDEGSVFPIPGSADGAGSLHWSSTGGTGHCAFGNDTAVPTSVRCDDNGVYTLTLDATDSFGQHSSSSFHLQVNNVAPSLTVSGPVSGGSPRNVTFNGIVTDPGANDALQCTIDWGDGTTDTVPVAGGFCSTTHTYDASRTTAGITATAKDDDGGVSAPRSISLNFNRAPVCIDVRSSLATLWPADHKLVLVTLGGASDPDGDALTYLVTAVRQDEALTGGGSGSTAFDAKLASGASVWIRAERAGTGDGRVYTISFTVTDPNGASCSGTTTVSVPHDQAHAAFKTPGVSVNSLG